MQAKRIGRLIGVVVSLLLVWGCSAAVAQSQTLSASLVHDGRTREFVYYVPTNLADPAPLVFMLHGGGGSSNGVMETLTEGRWNELADEHGFIVAYPQGFQSRWNDCRNDDPTGSTEDDVGFFAAMIDFLADRCCRWWTRLGRSNPVPTRPANIQRQEEPGCGRR